MLFSHQAPIILRLGNPSNADTKAQKKTPITKTPPTKLTEQSFSNVLICGSVTSNSTQIKCFL